ncbi:hypothetical protein [Kitasatospora sp. NPDC004272]
MADDPWLTGLPVAAPASSGAAGPGDPEPCWRCDHTPATTRCRICQRPLCTDCRIDHYHEGWE